LPDDKIDDLRTALTDIGAKLSVGERVHDCVQGGLCHQLVDGGLDPVDTLVASHRHILRRSTSGSTHPFSVGIVITRPKKISDHLPERRQCFRARFGIVGQWAEACDKYCRLQVKAWSRYKELFEVVHNSRAVRAGVCFCS